MITRRGRLSAVGVAAIAAASLLAGCGSSSGTGAEQSAAPSTSKDASLAAMVPASIKKAGVIKVGSDTSYAPSEFLASDGQTAQGFDVDLFKAVAGMLGVKANFTTAKFDSIIEGVKSGKFDIGVSSFTINPKRNKVVTFVSYFNAGTQWFTKKGNPKNVTPDNACGKKISVQVGTVQIKDIKARSKKCTDAGKPEIHIDQYQGQDQATAAIVSGKDYAGLADSPVAAYAVKKTNGQLQLLGDIYESAPYGYAVPKGEQKFAKAMSQALNKLIADGTYGKILNKWGVQAGAIKKSTVHP